MTGNVLIEWSLRSTRKKPYMADLGDAAARGEGND
jgi:hypothetical protein